jgi:hypothetical protein
MKLTAKKEVAHMFKMPEKIVYALPEIIGNTNLFVGRKKEFDFFLGDWYKYLEKNFTTTQIKTTS